MSRRRRLTRAALAALCLVVLVACSGSGDGDGSAGGPKRLTQEQAELLATVRFRNYDAGVRAVSVTIADSATGGGGRLTGWVDFAGHLGYGSVEQAGAALGSVAWDGARVAVAEAAPSPAAFPIPESGWRADRLDARASALTQTLAILLDLGSDRPENPLLLRQSDAAFVRTDEVAGHRVVVLAGPSPAQAQAESAAPSASVPDDGRRVRYWIDDDGLVRRVQLRLAGTSGWTVVDLSEAPGVTLDADRIASVLS